MSDDQSADRRTELAGDRTELASERTELASERTQLAWWRTGLTSLAVAVGIGRVVPELQTTGNTWPYVALGVAFGLYGIAMFVRGTLRSWAEATALGHPRPRGELTDLVVAAVGPLLGIAVVALVLFE